MKNLISLKAVEKAIKDGNVSMRRHPQQTSLVILNYTQQAQFARAWDNITMACRGLVVDWDNTILVDGEEMLPIIIHAPKKFFNDIEPNAPDSSRWSWGDLFIGEKLDGYYISIRDDSKYGLIVTSRGSFENKYVDAAKKLLPQLLAKDTDFFCELLQDFSEDSGIIVMHHPIARLVCWGVDDTIPYIGCGWGGEIVKEVSQSQLETYMKQDVEGVVVFNKVTKERVKKKTQWYLEMHRLISDCTLARTFEIISGGGTIKDQKETTFVGKDGQTCTLTISNFPEEHYIKMCEWEKEIQACYNRLFENAVQLYETWQERTPKDFALHCNAPKEIKNIVFKMFQHKTEDDISKACWKTVSNRLLRNPTN